MPQAGGFFTHTSDSPPLQVTFNVEMVCGGCSGACQKILQKQPGKFATS
jgi:hypothetical protein